MPKFKIGRTCSGWNHVDEEIFDFDDLEEAEEYAWEWATELVEGWAEEIEEDLEELPQGV